MNISTPVITLVEDDLRFPVFPDFRRDLEREEMVSRTMEPPAE